ncbi:hypothetical protein AJ79_02326 [Helicocarpus griseus UAMH5409]|uniref:AB hydrolase-1 domain-containing protein n=1 Tax=Helicocarpus griseus UAMH5409 TaxID=1447875 RepID=A0A2B7XUU6_9EURO|nr:hypothetical protein AJ79_02326 [Helicocarpus griseus UAMH5409]
MAPGLLYVTMQPGPSLPPAQFHDWYNNEHGPTRLRLPFITNGFRFRTTDTSGSNPTSPEWLAIYDVTDMAEMKREPYLRLRRDDVKSTREKETMAQIAIERKLFDFVESRECEGYVPLEAMSEAAAEAQGKEKRVLVAITQTLHADQEEEFNNWYRTEHLPLLSKVPGWLRTRRFVSSAVEPTETKEYLSLHEYVSHEGPSGPEIQAMNATPWRERVMSTVVRGRSRRVYEHYYTFGPAPRDLSSLSTETAIPFTSPDGLTKALPPSATPTTSLPAIESYITTADNVRIPYRLEGNTTDPHAPLLLLSNSILTHHAIWTDFITAFFAKPQNRQYRILRYLTRGRARDCGEKPVTLDVLAEDIIALLDALRVPRAKALVGVSLGGATVLNTSLKYPGRTAGFVACDTNPVAPAANRKAWGERIQMAEGEGMVDKVSGERLVGERLAEVTVKRWFTEEGYGDDGVGGKGRAGRVREMVRDNSLEGFRRGVEALFQYDLREEMKGYDGTEGRAAFLVGKEDGVLPKTMREMVGMMGGGAEFFEVEGAGHLPMVERPERVAEVIGGFLEGVK